ncbi:MAG: hypothetical protein LC751_12480 [Actinobacteria bacterium]|nr:hypothetical protein [Actinomycetota bacterium]
MTGNAKTLAWLDRALTQARNVGQRRLEDLLQAVWTEVIFETYLYADMPDGRPPADPENGKQGPTACS